MENITPSTLPDPEQIREMTELLSRSGYRVIRPLDIRMTYSEAPPPEKLITVAILDTETTGINHSQDKIIELGMVLVEVCPPCFALRPPLTSTLNFRFFERAIIA